ncbi:hypothetical protein Tco_0002927 [Tanacetum coccineum]
MTLAVDLIAQEFDIEFRDKKGAENLAADQLSRADQVIRRCVSGQVALTFSKLPQWVFWGDTLVPITQPEKSSIQDYIGPPSTRIAMLCPHVDFPDCEDSLACSIHMSFTSSASFWESSLEAWEPLSSGFKPLTQKEWLGSETTKIQVPEPPVRQPSVESSNLEKPDNPPIVTMADNRTMAQLLEAPTEELRTCNSRSNLQSKCINLSWDMLSKFVTANTASTSGSGTLPGNTVTNPKEDLKGEITLRVGKEASHSIMRPNFKIQADYDHLCRQQIDVSLWLVLFILKRKELKLCEAKTVESSVNEPPEVELKELPPHLEYAFLEGDDKLPVIIAKDLKDEEKAALLKVLKSHKRAIAWKLSDIKGVNEFLSES